MQRRSDETGGEQRNGDEEARKILKVTLKRARDYYNLSERQVEFSAGDTIFLLDKGSKKGRMKKLDPIWVGPGVITHKIHPISFGCM